MGADGSEEYQAGLTQFQAAARKRESIRLKLQMGAAPGVLEKDLTQKIKIEESVCKVWWITDSLLLDKGRQSLVVVQAENLIVCSAGNFQVPGRL